MEKHARQLCPACAKREGVPLIFGFPSDEDFREQERGNVILAGCVLDSESNLQCRKCAFRWRSRQGDKEKVDLDTEARAAKSRSLVRLSERMDDPLIPQSAGERDSTIPSSGRGPNVSVVPAIVCFIFAMIVMSFFEGAVTCSDGWASGAIGRSGACAHHRGVNSLPQGIRFLLSLLVAWAFHRWRVNRAKTR